MQIYDCFIDSIKKLEFLSLDDAIDALNSGDSLGYVSSFPEHYGEHENQYGMFRIKDMEELEIVYKTKGIGIVHKACVIPENIS